MNRKIEEKNYNICMECDMIYPEKLHDLHNNYPLAPERMVIDNKLKKSKYQESIITKIKKEYDIKLDKSKASKLVSTLSNKTFYVVHAEFFRKYKHLGLQMNVTKILSFKAKPWMKDFITFNIDKRKEAKNDFEVKFFKLMNNSVYGKTMENVRKRCNMSVVDNEDETLKHIAQPTFIDLKIINDNFIIIRKTKNKADLCWSYCIRLFKVFNV